MCAHTLIGLSITPFFSRAELSISLLFFLFTKLAARIWFHYYLLLLSFLKQSLRWERSEFCNARSYCARLWDGDVLGPW